MTLSEETVAEVRHELLRWYETNKRDLPWRHTDDPYAIWVSEIMLQQTQVATVVDYWERWMQSFSTVGELAAADLDDVLEHWAGLGYYRRARYLHQAAQKVVDDYGSRLPETADELQQLPGVGRYTAGAIASVAFGESAPIVDGNVIRVLSRLFALEGPPRSTQNQKVLWSWAADLVDPDRPGDFNQSMMELGATICSPRRPSCLLCPVREMCEAYRLGEPTEYPWPAKRVEKTPAQSNVAVVESTSRSGTAYLIVQRPSDGLHGGLWEFPTVEVRGENAKAPDVQPFLEEIGVDATHIGRLGSITHIFSHLKMTYQISSWSADAQRSKRGEWVTREAIESYAVSAAMKKVLALLDAEP